MKLKTSELTRAALSYSVAKCMGYEDKDFCPHDKHFRDEDNYWFSPVDDWRQGGPIIEQEEISIVRVSSALWDAHMSNVNFFESGPTPLIAAMRCYVASKLGDEVDVPSELTDTLV